MIKHPNKDIPATWKKFRKGMCDDCQATCCKMPTEIKLPDLVRLDLAFADEDPRVVAKRLTKEQIVSRYRHSTRTFTLSSRIDGSCYFLDKNCRCSVYDKRPDTCRDFPMIGSRPGYCPAIPKIKKSK